MNNYSTRPGAAYLGHNSEAGAGASDGMSGGGAGAGIPSGDLAIRAGFKVGRGSVEEDKKKLFPELFEKKETKLQQPREVAKRSIRRRQQRRRLRGGNAA